MKLQKPTLLSSTMLIRHYKVKIIHRDAIIKRLRKELKEAKGGE